MDMTRFLIGLLALGWLGCSVEPPQAPAEAEPAAPTMQEAEQAIEADVGPRFSQCLAGASCVLDEDCSGARTTVTCGVGKHCCNPVGCAGICEPSTFCTAGNQFIDTSAICPNGGRCCITLLVD
jgi:hypothetical protein